MIYNSIYKSREVKDMDIRFNGGAYLQHHRKLLGMSQTTLCDRVYEQFGERLYHSKISGIEKGKDVPKGKWIVYFATVLNINIAEWRQTCSDVDKLMVCKELGVIE